MDKELDVLSYQQRRPRVHILTLDSVLAADIYERLRSDSRTRFYDIALPKQAQLRERIEEIEGMAGATISSRALIMDVRTTTLATLAQAFNKIIGYNRRDLNKFCFTVLVGDGPANLFGAGKSIDVFVPHLAAHRVNYNSAVFFFDPFIHYELQETDSMMDEELVLPTRLPKRLAHYFPEEGVTVDSVRRYFRAPEQSEAVRKQRLKVLAAMYMKRIVEQFPQDKDRLRGLLSKDGQRLASEKLSLYPLFFEQWVHELMQRAAEAQT